jgi:hypothetical protein
VAGSIVTRAFSDYAIVRKYRNSASKPTRQSSFKALISVTIVADVRLAPDRLDLDQPEDSL